MSMKIGTASWSVPKASADAFPPDGAVLERYASVFSAVEINSTFYRSHRRTTYERWAAMVPASFRFSVKVPRAISHEARLRDCNDRIKAFTEDVAVLGTKLGPLLLQLAPSMAFDPDVVDTACALLSRAGRLACEPRHASWFTPAVDRWLAERGIARVAADPRRAADDGQPGGWLGLAYHRLHGAPKIYYSPYAAETLAALAKQLLCSSAEETWCVFDNTALGSATADALALGGMLAAG